MADALELAKLIDPEWRDHFLSPDEAVEHYRVHAREQHDAAVRELRKATTIEVVS